LSEDSEGKTFSIQVILNFELERELLGFGAKLKVLAPRNLVKRIREQLEASLKRYKSV
jgi:predicted DNA-binding transcriptional regulator YafY